MPEYLKALRKTAGTIPILVCGASVIVENEKGEILLQLRSDNKCWGFPGGTLDIGDKVEDIAKAELLEETGIIAHGIEFFDVFSGEELYHKYPNGDEIYVVDIVYTCKNYSGTPRADHIETDDVKFFPLDNLPTNITPPQVSSIKKYIEYRKQTNKQEEEK
jgi:8-oxo-dGTP pyrophosphatase MutT (NUDIX family)